MDIKDLNRSQFLLLLLLIILVTSTTTAVVTVTLLDQSPQAGITNTVNRVIERVVPGATTTIVKIVREEPANTEGERIIKAIESISPTMIKLVRRSDKGNEDLGSGFVVREGLAVTALRNVPQDLSSPTGASLGIVKNAIVYRAEILSRDLDNNIAFIKFTATSTLNVGPLVFDDKLPTSGQTNVALAYSDSGNPDIVVGLVLGVVEAITSATSSSQRADIVRTGAVVNDNLGGPVVGLDGKVIGIGISRGYALSASTLKSLIDQIK